MDEHPLAGPVNPRAPIGRRDSVGSEDQDAPRRPSADVEKAMVLVKDTILALFPDICPEYLQTLAACRNYDCNDIVLDILDNHGEEGSYPRRQEPNLKRKRADEIDDDAEAEMRKFDNPDRRRERKSQNYIVRAIALLMCAFPRAYQKDVAGILMENDNCLFPAFMAMHDRESGKGPGAPLSRKVRATRMEPGLKENEIDATIRSLPQGEEKTIIEEFRAARRAAHELTVKWNEEETNINRAKAEGTITECGCCFDEQPMNRMVHCDSQEKHWFCCACAKQMAETQVGLSKYELNCMSMDGCAGGFSHSQRDVFLDAKLTLALDLLEQEANVRMAGIENLETCPSCPFAAECPPIEIDKEFRCMNPECGIVICRMCRRKTHLPKTCMEAAAAGDSARHTIEEAMSAALIRKCNKCGTPFIKLNGCNKMTCTRGGCNNVQCYICHKSCDYSHFNDRNRGGKAGNCPLFDESIEQRHENEVREAEKKTRQQILEAGANFDEELLDVKVSYKVKEDDARRKEQVGNAVQPAGGVRFGFQDLNRIHRRPQRAAPAAIPAPPAGPGAAVPAIRPTINPQLLNANADPENLPGPHYGVVGALGPAPPPDREVDDLAQEVARLRQRLHQGPYRMNAHVQLRPEAYGNQPANAAYPLFEPLGAPMLPGQGAIPPPQRGPPLVAFRLQQLEQQQQPQGVGQGNEAAVPGPAHRLRTFRPRADAQQGPAAAPQPPRDVVDVLRREAALRAVGPPPQVPLRPPQSRRELMEAALNNRINPGNEAYAPIVGDVPAVQALQRDWVQPMGPFVMVPDRRLYNEPANPPSDPGSDGLL